MMGKLLVLLSIAFNTIGFGGQAGKIDSSIIKSQINPTNRILALNNLGLPEIYIRPEIKRGSPEATANAHYWILADSESGTILAKKATNDRVPIASTTKIMTAIIVLESYNLDDVIVISSAAANQIGASANFQVGEKITILNLLKALLIKSANGAAYALAEYMNTANEIGTAKFVAKMNDKAKELGMNDTDYHDPAGLDVTGYSSAFDLYLVTKYALTKPVFSEIVKIKETRVTDVTGKIWHQLENSNRLVREWDYPGAIGVKTGYMPEAGHVLVGAAERDNHTLISVVIKTYADTPDASAQESRRLLDWGFANVIWH